MAWRKRVMLAELIDPAILGFILIGVMLFSIFVGFPISFTLIFLGFVFGYLGFGKLVFYLMTLQFSMVMTEQTLAAVPLFVFMGIMMEQAGLMERLFSAFQLMLAKVRGSLYYAVLFVSVVFCCSNRDCWSVCHYTWNYGCKINEQIWI
ncbi:TRAP transporter large permease subunit [Candidatus Pelagibacter bacterium]|nr:TRAP transporter large permease subunit [Candidatus Pelagibacter bacterium]